MLLHRLFFFAFLIIRCNDVYAQERISTSTIDSLIYSFDHNTKLTSYKLIDSANIFKKTLKVPVYTLTIQTDPSQIIKLEWIGSGTCDANEIYYFLERKLLKAVIYLKCKETIFQDGVIYYRDDLDFEQTDPGLYGPAFKQSAYQLLTRALQLKK